MRHWDGNAKHVICKKVSAGIETYPLPCTSPYLAASVIGFSPSLRRYCCEVWGCMGKIQCDRLQRLQNRARKIVTFSD